MSFQKNQKTLHQILLDTNMNTARSTNQTRLALPPLRIPTLTTAGLTTPFRARVVLSLSQESLVGSPTICEDGFVPVVLGNIFPHKSQHCIAAISKDKPKNLSHQARNGNPYPEGGGKLDADLIDLDGVSFRSGDGCNPFLLDFTLYANCVFLRMLRIVKRETLWLLAIPLWEILSCNEARMRASFSGVMARFMGWRVKVLRQAWQRQRAVPLRFVPNLMQSALVQ
jgi:hypothetical protein